MASGQSALHQSEIPVLNMWFMAPIGTTVGPCKMPARWLGEMSASWVRCMDMLFCHHCLVYACLIVLPAFAVPPILCLELDCRNGVNARQICLQSLLSISSSSEIVFVPSAQIRAFLSKITRRTSAAWASLRKYSPQHNGRPDAQLRQYIHLLQAEVVKAMLSGCAISTLRVRDVRVCALSTTSFCCARWIPLGRGDKLYKTPPHCTRDVLDMAQLGTYRDDHPEASNSGSRGPFFDRMKHVFQSTSCLDP